MFLNWCWKQMASLTGRQHAEALQREQHRVRRLDFDSLEDRCMMSTAPINTPLQSIILPDPTKFLSLLTRTQANTPTLTPALKATSPAPAQTDSTSEAANLEHVTYLRFNPNNGGSPTPVVGAFTPAMIAQAYCINQISFNGIVGDGTGQTIAIIDAYDNPAFVDSTNPGFVNSDLHQFDVAMGLPDPPSFRKIDQNGGTTYPPVDPAGAGNSNFEGEEALDVEWAHAIAPQANIILIETDDNSDPNLIVAGVTEARRLPNVSVVSMSFGGPESPDPTMGTTAAQEAALDPLFTTPAGHIGMTFLASTGDSGAPGGYPAYSPNVVAVGGTTLTTDPLGNYISETGWGNGANSNTLGGSGGGPSLFEPQPVYQVGVVTQSVTQRTIPDVAFDADPNTGVNVYDSYNNVDGSGPWVQIGGTSLSCPCWASLIAIADQGRAPRRQGKLDGAKADAAGTVQTAGLGLPRHHFRETMDSLAGPGYDLVTGIGSPLACMLVPALLSAQPTGTQIGGLTMYYPLRFVYDSTTGLYNGNLTFINANSTPLSGNFTFILPGLPPSVTVVNGGQSSTGQPTLLVTTTLPPNKVPVRIPIQLRDPLRVPLPTFFMGFPLNVALD